MIKRIFSYTRRESNPYLRYRKPTFYSLNYRCFLFSGDKNTILFGMFLMILQVISYSSIYQNNYYYERYYEIIIITLHIFSVKTVSYI